jgi:hypothetical protein
MADDPFIETLKAAGLEEVRYRLARNAYNDVDKRRSKAKAWVAVEELRIAAEAQATQDSRTADAGDRQASASGLAARVGVATLVVGVMAAILTIIAMVRHQ